MRIAVLPFNASSPEGEALGRQIAALIQQYLQATQAADEVGGLNYMAQQEDENGQVRYLLASPGTGLNEEELIQQIQQQGEPDMVADGLVEGGWREGSIHIRLFEESPSKPAWERQAAWTEGGMLAAITPALVDLARAAGAEVAGEMTSVASIFQTEDDEAWNAWAEAADAAMYVERSQGMVQVGWSPEAAYNAAILAIERQPEWDQPVGVLLGLVRLCFQARLGTPDMGINALNRLQELRKDNAFVLFHVGSFFSDFGDPNKGGDLLEKAARLEPNQPGIWTKLGMTQAQLGMPVNAERSLKKAIELTAPADFDPSPYDVLATVLDRQGRAHEIPKIWKDVVESQPENGVAHARYAMALLVSGNRPGAVDFLEQSLTKLEDNTVIKRFYAPLLREDQDYDRAMDFYEDVLEESPNDIPVMLELAETMVAGDRQVDAVDMYKSVAAVAQDPNTKAQATAVVLELEQPNRVKVLEEAAAKAETDVQAALKDLKPLKNWLADYWKLWVLLASLHNRVGEYGPAEEAANHALTMFPACEPAVSELVNALTGQNKLEEAFNLAAAAQQAMPQSLPMAIQLGMAAKRVGRSEEARGLARQIREAVGPNEELEPILVEMER